MIQQEKTKRLHNSLYAREKRNLALVDTFHKQIKKLVCALNEQLPPEPAYKKMVFEGLRPLYDKITDLMGLTKHKME